MAPDQKPTPGRVVLYHFAVRWKADGNHEMASRPAMVTSVNDDGEPHLFVYFEHDDWEDSHHGGGLAISRGAPYNRYAISKADGKPEPGTWSWPPRV
jgi:hypothetical protein